MESMFEFEETIEQALVGSIKPAACSKFWSEQRCSSFGLRKEQKLEISLFVICSGLTTLLYCVENFKMVVLNLFYLPIVLAAFYLGRQRAGILALTCVILASTVAVIDLDAYAASTSPLVIGLALTVWGAVMGLNAIFVGTLSDERSKTIAELHDAYVGVVEVLARYLKMPTRP